MKMEDKEDRELQSLAEEELGIRPKLSTCQLVLADAESTRDHTRSREEHLATVFLSNETRLRVSAEKREAERGRLPNSRRCLARKKASLGRAGRRDGA